MTVDQLREAMRKGTKLTGTDEYGHTYTGTLERRNAQGNWILAFQIDPTGRTCSRSLFSAVDMRAEDLDYADLADVS